MNLLERIRRFWKPLPDIDHPLSEQEREEFRPASASDEVARAAADFVGADFDPDAPRAD